MELNDLVKAVVSPECFDDDWYGFLDRVGAGYRLDRRGTVKMLEREAARCGSRRELLVYVAMLEASAAKVGGREGGK